MTAAGTPDRRTRRDLLDVSLGVLRDSQAPSGAYLASPSFSQYGYCWLRDGAFIALALDLAGEHASAGAFHRWVARTITRYRGKVERLERHAARAGRAGLAGDGLSFGDEEILHTRFTAQGDELAEDWGNFQLDGYGFWLASLERHLEASGEDRGEFAGAAELALRYLAILWDRPCYDCWEEYPTRRHSTTWAAVAAGLAASARLLERPDAAALAEHVLDRLRREATREGVLLKFAGADDGARQEPATAGGSALAEARAGDGNARARSAGPEPRPRRALAGHERVGKPLPPDAIDGSALLVLGALGPFPPDDPLVGATLTAVERRLVAEGGGVHRYEHDEYYGGGLWLLLAGALAEVAAARGDVARAREVLHWIERQPDDAGHLPEQVARHLRHPELLEPWRERWGPIASPLAWSHAMYVAARTSTQ